MATEASLANVRRTVVLDNPAALGVVTTEGVTNLVTAVDDPTGRTYGTKTLKLATPHDEKTHFATIRIYGCRIWEKENGDYVLKRDYVPAVENNVAGLRDEMTEMLVVFAFAIAETVFLLPAFSRRLQ